MDDEDAYGIPSDYYHPDAMLQGYPDNASISPFDDILDEVPADDLFEDFAECMRVAGISSISREADFHAMIVPLNSSAERHFRGPSEPGLEVLDAGTLDRRGLGPCSSRLLPRSTSPEFGSSASRRDQNSRCMHSIARRFLLTDSDLYYYECGSRRARASGVALYKIRTFYNTGSKQRALCKASFGINTRCKKEIAVPGKETHAIPMAFGFAWFQNYVRVHASCVLLQRLSTPPPLADMYRALFKFGVFNAMQSSCFDTVRKQALQRCG